MKRIIIHLFFIFTTLSAYSQNSTDTIQVIRSFGTAFKQNGQLLKPRDLVVITSSNSEAYEEMKLAKVNYDFGIVLSTIGGGLIGWTLGSSLSNKKETSWALAYVGGGLIVVSIPLSIAYSKHARSAVKIYNEGVRKISLSKKVLYFGLTKNMFCLKAYF
jgi:hypothetical protein